MLRPPSTVLRHPAASFNGRAAVIGAGMSASPGEKSSAIADLVGILTLERLEHNLFRGLSPQVGWQRAFGGLVEAAPAPHSLHAYFLLAGDPLAPIIYEVDRIREGRSFVTRRVIAIQHGQAIFALSCSFHVEEPGFEHQLPMPDVPAPDALPSEAEIKARVMPLMPDPIRKYYERERPIELRPVDFDRYTTREPREPQFRVWMRANGALPEDPGIHRAVLAYASDMTLLDTALVAHGRTIFEPDIMPASLDHALWIHQPFRADEWLLYAQDSPITHGARGLCRGLIYAQDGRLVASVAQEGLVRRIRKA
jgi:acyl-CoA thioesterase II